jgi:hypothetical protein
MRGNWFNFEKICFDNLEMNSINDKNKIQSLL